MKWKETTNGRTKKSYHLALYQVLSWFFTDVENERVSVKATLIKSACRLPSYIYIYIYCVCVVILFSNCSFIITWSQMCGTCRFAVFYILCLRKRCRHIFIIFQLRDTRRLYFFILFSGVEYARHETQLFFF